MRPKIRATASSVPTLVQPLPASSSIPDTAQVATPRAAAETSTRSTNLINQILLEFGGWRGGESGVLGWQSVELVWGFGGCGGRRGRVAGEGLGGRDGVAAEEAAVGVGGGAAPDAEVVAQGGGVTEAGSVGDDVDGLVGLLEELLGQQDALPGEPALWGGPGVLHEAARKGPLGHVRAGGQLADGKRLVQVGAQPFQQVAQGAVAGRSDGLDHVLGLAAVAVRRDDHAAGDAVGDPGTLFLPDQVEAGVDAGRGTGAGDHRVVVDVQDVGIDLGVRVAAGQLGRVPPVRGAAAVIEQAGVTQDEGAAADAQHARAAVNSPAQRLEQVLGEAAGRGASTRIGVQAQAHVADRGQGDQVGLLQPLQAVRG